MTHGLRGGRKPAPNCGYILSLIPALGRRMSLRRSSSRRGYCGSLLDCVRPYEGQPSRSRFHTTEILSMFPRIARLSSYVREFMRNPWNRTLNVSITTPDRSPLSGGKFLHIVHWRWLKYARGTVRETCERVTEFYTPEMDSR